MTVRRHLRELLTREPRSVSSLARELGLGRRDLELDLQHMLRSAAARGERIEILPAKCKGCGFEFGPERLAKPGRCPVCKASRIMEAMIRLGATEATEATENTENTEKREKTEKDAGSKSTEGI